MIQSPSPSNRFVVFNADLPGLAFDTLLWSPGASPAPRAILIVEMFPLFLECNSLSLLRLRLLSIELTIPTDCPAPPAQTLEGRLYFPLKMPLLACPSYQTEACVRQ